MNLLKWRFLMKKINVLLFILLAFSFITSSLSSKCYSFRKVNSIKVCTNSDSNKDRKKAQEICSSILKSDCGGVAGYTGSCNKAEKIKCYNEDGIEKKSISVD